MQIPPATALLLVSLLIVVVLTLLFHERLRLGRLIVRLRPLRALAVLQQALAYGAETGRALHVSPGSGSIGGRGSTAETIAGLLMAERVASEAALSGTSLLASSGDAVTHLALRGTVRQAYQHAGVGQGYHPSQVQLLAHQDPMAYASGITTLYGRQKLEASQLIGAFDQELLLAAEVGAQLHVPQIIGVSSATAQPLAILAADSVLIGEELYAAEAYLATAATAQARLFTQDALRVVVIVAMVILALLGAFGLQISL